MAASVRDESGTISGGIGTGVTGRGPNVRRDRGESEGGGQCPVEIPGKGLVTQEGARELKGGVKG